MKTNKKDFELFKLECEKWINKFELNGFQFRFYWKEDDTNRACVDINQIKQGLIKIYFGKEWSNDPITEKEIKKIAKHEMIHCLIADFAFSAYKRFMTEDELYKLEEKLVNRLNKLI